MAALAGILEDDGNIVCGVDIDHEVFTEKELIKRQIKYDTFSNDLKIPEDIDFFVIGHDFMNHEIMKQIKATHKPYQEYHIFINS